MENLYSLFGSVFITGNGLSKISGTRNTGVMENNSNLTIVSQDSELNLQNNSNSQINVKKTNLSAFGTKNAKISTQDATLILNNDSNIEVAGSKSNYTLVMNENFKINGNNGKCVFKNNKNTKIHGNQNEIIATGNSNLTVIGDNNKLNIDGTDNHLVQVVPKGNGILNKLKVFNDTQGQGTKTTSMFGLFNRTFTRNSNSIGNQTCFEVSYVDQAAIKYGKYELGIFQLQVDNQVPNEVIIKIEESCLDSNSLQLVSEAQSKLLLQATKQGRLQQLELMGSKITKDIQNANFFKINLHENASF